MTRRSWVYIDGVAYERGVDPLPNEGTTTMGQAPAVLGDIAEFRSSIDGSVINSRAVLRDHMARHNVVLTADLQGLPPKLLNQNTPLSAAHREGTKRVIADIINSRNY